MTPPLALSRVAASAASLSRDASDAHRFADKRVLLTGETVVLVTPGGRSCLLSSLRLLLRICRDVTVALPADLPALEQECRDLGASLAFGEQRLGFTRSTGRAVGAYDAVLNIGTTARPGEPWTVINADGWVARVSSGDRDLPTPRTAANPISSLAAASLGVGEVFKRLIVLSPSRGELLDAVGWNLFTYELADRDTGPPLPQVIHAEPLIVGAGAIGNGLMHLLAELPSSGRAWVVDPQAYGEENLGTCLLVGPKQVGLPKAEFAERVLAARFDAKGYIESLERFSERLGSELPHPRIVLAGLDNIAARHAVQDLWADTVIDGAIGTFLCQVGRHPAETNVACLRCVFREAAGEAAEVRGSRATGLAVSRVAMANELISQVDVETAPPEKRQWLAARLGRPVCSVVQEAVATEISLAPQKGFAPSAPFVACLSACMIASEFVKAATGLPSKIEPRVQLDFLRGPSSIMPLAQERRRDCTCVERRTNIDRLRRSRTRTERRPGDGGGHIESCGVQGTQGHGRCRLGAGAVQR